MRKHYDMRMAVLIDADNADSSLIEAMLEAASAHGRVTIKRIYANWTLNYNGSWKRVLNQYAIRPIQKFTYTTGKNSTDTALIMDAMDILHHGKVDGFCIVSSDSDYTGLAQRISEEGLMVMGIGMSKTPQAFQAACHHFITTDSLRPQQEITPPIAAPVVETKTETPMMSIAPAPEAKTNMLERIPGMRTITGLLSRRKRTEEPLATDFFDKAFELAKDEAGYAEVKAIEAQLANLITGFDCKRYGYKDVFELCESRQPAYRILFDRHRNKKVFKAA